MQTKCGFETRRVNAFHGLGSDDNTCTPMRRAKAQDFDGALVIAPTSPSGANGKYPGLVEPAYERIYPQQGIDCGHVEGRFSIYLTGPSRIVGGPRDWLHRSLPLEPFADDVKFLLSIG